MAGFDSLVLSAEEFQPPADAYPGVEVYRVPFDDQEGRISRRQWRKIVFAAEWVAENVTQGRRTLVTCQMGINRSGLVTALAVMMLTGWSGERAVEHVRAKRRGALRNRSFAAHVMAVRT